MEVFVNGEAREIGEGATLAELLEAAGAPQQGVAVEVNQALVRKTDLATTQLAAGDRVEVVGLVGGG